MWIDMCTDCPIRLFHPIIDFDCFSGSILDLNAFERQNKAESLGMVTEEGSSKICSMLLLHFCMN